MNRRDFFKIFTGASLATVFSGILSAKKQDDIFSHQVHNKLQDEPEYTFDYVVEITLQNGSKCCYSAQRIEEIRCHPDATIDITLYDLEGLMYQELLGSAVAISVYNGFRIFEGHVGMVWENFSDNTITLTVKERLRGIDWSENNEI